MVAYTEPSQPVSESVSQDVVDSDMEEVDDVVEVLLGVVLRLCQVWVAHIESQSNSHSVSRYM